jgi:hypothetical protein
MFRKTELAGVTGARAGHPAKEENRIHEVQRSTGDDEGGKGRSSQPQGATMHANTKYAQGGRNSSPEKGSFSTRPGG